MSDTTSKVKEYNIAAYLKDTYPDVYLSFEQWWLKQVVEYNVPCTAKSTDGVDLIFAEWPFAMQVVYYLEFLFTEYNITIILTNGSTVERMRQIVCVSFEQANDTL